MLIQEAAREGEGCKNVLKEGNGVGARLQCRLETRVTIKQLSTTARRRENL